MNYEVFLEEVADYVRMKIDEEVEIGIHTITKNNGVQLSGLCIRNNKINASPTIYMEHYYNRYMSGDSIEEIGDSIISVYYKSALHHNVEIERFTDFSRVKDKLFFKLVNYEKNVSILENTPYEKYLDMALIPYCYLTDCQIGNGSITIRNDHLKLWDKSANEVLEIARFNTENNMAYELKPLMEVLMSSVNDESGQVHKNSEYPDIPLFVVTNVMKMNGAVFMASKERLSEFAKTLGGDYYIIPSSIHELILLPKSEDEDIDRLNSMIQEINESEVGADEVLADHAYLYSERDEVLIF